MASIAGNRHSTLVRRTANHQFLGMPAPLGLSVTNFGVERTSQSRQPAGETRGGVWRPHSEWARIDSANQLNEALRRVLAS